MPHTDPQIAVERKLTSLKNHYSLLLALAFIFLNLSSPAWVVAQPVTCNGLVATIIGTASSDVITGTNGNDVIVGLGGNDVINGGNGNDIVCGGEGADTISGGNGDDTLFGEAGNDVLNGE